MLDAQFWFGFILGTSIMVLIYLLGMLFYAVHLEVQEEKKRLEEEQRRNDGLTTVA